MGPLVRLAYSTMTLTIAAALVHCGSGQCADCGEPKPPSTVLQGSASCPTSTPPLTRSSLLDHLGGNFVGRTAPTSLDTMTVAIEVTTGVVTCEPSYASGLAGVVPATVRADARISIQSNGAAPKGVIQGAVARSAGLDALNDPTFDTSELDPATVGYTPKTAGTKVRVFGRLHPDGTLSATVYEGTGSKAVPVLTYEP